MDNAQHSPTPTERRSGAFLMLRRLWLGAWRGVLTSITALAAFFAGGTVFAIVGKPIWLWITWLWNLY